MPGDASNLRVVMTRQKKEGKQDLTVVKPASIINVITYDRPESTTRDTPTNGKFTHSTRK